MKDELKRKTLVQIDLPIWAEVRYFATINKISNNTALETLLVKALNDHSIKNKRRGMLAGGNVFGNHPPAASEVQ